jgi:DNA/RNA endonuclease YhcR with UshA esterase domain
MFSFAVAKDNEISAKEAVFKIGQPVVACAEVKEVTSFSKGTYLNFDDKYPNQSLTIVIWDSRKQKIVSKLGRLDELIGLELCISGKVTEYRGRHQIILNSSHAIRKNS